MRQTKIPRLRVRWCSRSSLRSQIRAEVLTYRARGRLWRQGRDPCPLVAAITSLTEVDFHGRGHPGTAKLSQMAAAAHEFVPKALTVKIWGLDASGRPFASNARTVRIAEKAVEIDLTRQLSIGDLVGLTFGPKKARFRVVNSFISAADTYRIILELESVMDCLWPVELASPDVIVDSKQERRREPRFPIIGLAHIFTADGTSSSARLVDISHHGCYIETFAPSAVGAELTVKLAAEDQQVNARAVVRTSHPSIGMGLEIVDFAEPADEERFNTILGRVGI